MTSERIEAFDIFAAPIYRLHYDNYDMAKACVDMVHKFESADAEPCYYPFGYTSFNKQNVENGNVIFSEEIRPLAEYLWGATQTIHDLNNLSGTVAYASSWLTIGRKYSYHERHHHNPHTWSGVYYAQAEEDDAEIIFYNPMMDSGWPHAESKEFNNHNSMLSTNSVKTGDVIIFPSYLEHKVDQQLHDRERITLAFNFNIEK